MRILVCFILIFSFANDALTCTPHVSFIKTKAIYGKIIDEYNRPIPGASVQIYKINDGDEEKILAETKADENGRFEISNFPSGKYAIRADFGDDFRTTYAQLKLKKSSKKVKDEEIIFTLVTIADCSGKVEVKKFSETK